MSKKKAKEMYTEEEIRMLAYIREHRENYPAGTVWMDRNGVIWQRTKDERWTQFGSSSIWANTVPVRPLRQMKAQ